MKMAPETSRFGRAPSPGRRLSHRGRSAKARRNPPTVRVRHDPPLHPPGNGFHLGGADALQDLVRDRGACGGRPGGTGSDPERSREKTIWAKAKDVTFNVARIDEIERETKHDVIAFLTHLAEIVGPEARFVHQGMTSSDVLDTCLNVQLARAADLLISDVDKVLVALKKRAFEHKMTPTIGRSHGIHAEPVTFGLKLAYAYAEIHPRPRAACHRAQGGRDLRHLWRRRHLRPDRSARRSTRRGGDGAGSRNRSRPR